MHTPSNKVLPKKTTKEVSGDPQLFGSYRSSKYLFSRRKKFIQVSNLRVS